MSKPPGTSSTQCSATPFPSTPTLAAAGDRRRPTGCYPTGTPGTTRPDRRRRAERDAGMTEPQSKGRVVIVGGGFGGLFAALALRNGPYSVTLVDRSPQHVFQPLLYQCATGILSEGQITAPLRRVLRGHRNVRCVTAQAIDIDPAGRALECLLP